MAGRISRREAIRRAAVAGAVGAIPARALAQAGTAASYTILGAAEARTLEAVVARLIPSDENGPGATEAGAARYIDRALGGALSAARQSYARGLASLDRYARERSGRSFAELAPDAQDAVLRDLEQNAPAGFEPDAATFFELVLAHTLQGTFSDPVYGGNRDFIGWELIGYPGLRLAVGPEQQAMDADNALTRLSAYDLPMFDRGTDGSDDR